LGLIPALDDQQLVRTELPSIAYITSFRRFNDILAGDDLMDRGQALEPGDVYEDNTPLGKLMGIFSGKLDAATQGHNFETLSQQPGLANIYLRFQNLKEARLHDWREVINHQRVSPEAALIELLRIEEFINPKPGKTDTPRGWLNQSSFRDSGGFLGAALRKEIYEGKLDTERLHRAKWLVRSVYEGLRVLIGRTLSHQQLVGRFKARAAWYDKQRLRALVFDAATNTFIREREDTLVLEMAKWLFDSGLPVFVQPHLSNLEPDLLSVSSPSILIGGKAYIKEDKTILKNLAQLHAYLNTLDASQFHIEEAYYVVFRLAGPLYDFPRQLRHIIYPVVIDLGLADDSGRNQPPPLVVTREELQAVVTATAQNDSLTITPSEKA
jgi:hypothetical protein